MGGGLISLLICFEGVITSKGKREREGGTNAGFGVEPDFAFHFFEELFDDEETKTSARDTFGSFFFNTEETSKDHFLVFFRDADTLVFNMGDKLIVFNGVRDFNGALFGIFDGVAEKVGNDLAEPLFFGHDSD